MAGEALESFVVSYRSFLGVFLVNLDSVLVADTLDILGVDSLLFIGNYLYLKIELSYCVFIVSLLCSFSLRVSVYLTCAL